ncbi:MAG: peptide chain release factor N(5)-glutamine methyltransferase [Sphingorhabdus sp.]
MSEVATALMKAAQTLSATGETPRLDAELLMAHALQMERSDLLLRMRDLAVPPEFAALVQRRAAQEPVAYIRGYQDFWDLRIQVTPDTLIPRADSETLIEAAERHFKDAPPVRIADFGTGSGALLLAALSLFPDATGIGIDASEAALMVAQSNADTLGFGERSEFIHASWRDENWAGRLGVCDLILCNPPYVESTLTLMPSVQNYEPHSALFAGPDGLDDYQILIPQIPALLFGAGLAIFEIGAEQADAVSEIAKSAGLTAATIADLAGKARAVVMAADAR